MSVKRLGEKPCFVLALSFYDPCKLVSLLSFDSLISRNLPSFS